MPELFTDTVLLLALLFVFGCLALGLTLIVATIYFGVMARLSRRRAKRRRGWITDAIRDEKEWPT